METPVDSIAKSNSPAPRMPVPEPPQQARRAPRSTDFLALAREDHKDKKKQEDLESLKDSIIDMITTDLKDPLTVIQGNISYLLDEVRDIENLTPAKVEQILRTCLSNCRKQMNLIQDLQDVNQFNQQKYPLHKTRAYFPKLVDDCLAALAPVIGKQEVSIRKIYHANIPLISVDEGVIRRVLVNLLNNALKYTKSAEGKVTISVNWLDTQWLECIVEDNGMLIPREHLGKVFDKFFKGDQLGRFRKGQGLGLAFSRLAVEAHGGDIWAERSLPKGNRFVLLLPGL